jgi:hypothetical protein
MAKRFQKAVAEGRQIDRQADVKTRPSTCLSGRSSVCEIY